MSNQNPSVFTIDSVVYDALPEEIYIDVELEPGDPDYVWVPKTIQEVYRDAWDNNNGKGGRKILTPNLLMRRSTIGGGPVEEGTTFLNLSYTSNSVLGQELGHTKFVPQGFTVGKLGSFGSIANLMLWLANPGHNEFNYMKTKRVNEIIREQQLKPFESKYAAQVLAYGYYCRISQSEALSNPKYGLGGFNGKLHCYRKTTDGNVPGYETKGLDYVRIFAVEEIRDAIQHDDFPDFQWLWNNEGYEATLEELCDMVIAERQEECRSLVKSKDTVLADALASETQKAKALVNERKLQKQQKEKLKLELEKQLKDTDVEEPKRDLHGELIEGVQALKLEREGEIKLTTVTLEDVIDELPIAPEEDEPVVI